MATPFHFDLVAPERLLFSGEVEAVIVPSVEGEMTVLAQHAPVMAVLKAGIVTVDEGKGHARRLFVRGGFADITPAGLTILAEEARPVEEIDDTFIDEQVRAAEIALSEIDGDEAARARAAERLEQLREVQSVLRL
jgi:F-type H+-transporting ATPase subunit epsilon